MKKARAESEATTAATKISNLESVVWTRERIAYDLIGHMLLLPVLTVYSSIPVPPLIR
jgi:hypothetical protein